MRQALCGRLLDATWRCQRRLIRFAQPRPHDSRRARECGREPQALRGAGADPRTGDEPAGARCREAAPRRGARSREGDGSTDEPGIPCSVTADCLPIFARRNGEKPALPHRGTTGTARRHRRAGVAARRQAAAMIGPGSALLLGSARTLPTHIAPALAKRPSVVETSISGRSLSACCVPREWRAWSGSTCVLRATRCASSRIGATDR